MATWFFSKRVHHEEGCLQAPSDSVQSCETECSLVTWEDRFAHAEYIAEQQLGYSRQQHCLNFSCLQGRMVVAIVTRDDPLLLQGIQTRRPVVCNVGSHTLELFPDALALQQRHAMRSLILVGLWALGAGLLFWLWDSQVQQKYDELHTRTAALRKQMTSASTTTAASLYARVDLAHLVTAWNTLQQQWPAHIPLTQWRLQNEGPAGMHWLVEGQADGPELPLAELQAIQDKASHSGQVWKIEPRDNGWSVSLQWNVQP